MRHIDCTFDLHGEAVLAMVNDVIVSSVWVYDYVPRTIDSMREYFHTKSAFKYPIIGVQSESRELLGFASYGTFRDWPGYKYTVEHSVFVRRDARRRGVGRALMSRLIKIAEADQRHVMIGAIDSTNTASIELHLQLGFCPCANFKQVGYKNGQWLDAVFYQRILNTPDHPEDG